jgi:hypothetical protein
MGNLALLERKHAQELKLQTRAHTYTVQRCKISQLFTIYEVQHNGFYVFCLLHLTAAVGEKRE